MASNILKLPFSRVAFRGLASQASAASATKRDVSAEQSAVECTVLPNKIMVSSQDHCGGLSRISVVFRTGPRNEVSTNYGATHIIRSMTGFSTLQFTDFFILRNIQQCGGYLSCTGDRELTSFNLVGTRDNICNLLDFFASVVSAPAFKPWQITRNLPRIKYELSLLSPQIHTMELLHKAAFRNGLGNSLFISKEELGNHTCETLSDFFCNGFTAERAAVVGYNLYHKDVIKFAESFTLNCGNPPAGNSTYYGGEIRKQKNTDFATVAIATEGIGLKNLKETLTFGILQHAIGTKPAVIWGDSPSPLHKAISNTSETTATCLNISYTDTGLFGVILSGLGPNVGPAVKAAWKVLKSGSISEADIKRGKALFRTNLLHSSSNSQNMMDDMAVQSLINGSVVPACVLGEAIDKISSAEVQAAAKKIAGSKFSLAAYGNLHEVPYLDDLR